MTEQAFRAAKSLFETHRIFRLRDGTSRGHVSCSVSPGAEGAGGTVSQTAGPRSWPRFNLDETRGQRNANVRTPADLRWADRCRSRVRCAPAALDHLARRYRIVDPSLPSVLREVQVPARSYQLYKTGLSMSE
jgi:hypothetical protein